MPLFGLSPSDVAKMKDKRDVAGLIKALMYKKNLDVRRDAACALGQIRDSRAVEPLIVALKDQEELVRCEAAMSLGEIGDTRAVNALAIALHDPDKFVQWKAALALSGIRDSRAVDALVCALNDQDADLRFHVTQVLGYLGWTSDSRALDVLVAALKDANADVRFEAAKALVETGGEHKIDGLLVLLTHPDFKKRHQAVDGLAVILLRDQDRTVRRRAAEALDRFGSSAFAVDALIAALKDTDMDVRKYAMEALGKIPGYAIDNRKHAAVVDALIVALKDTDMDVRKYAMEALGKTVNTRAVDALIAVLRDPEAEGRNVAAKILGTLRWDRERILPVLHTALFDADELVRAESAKAIPNLEHTEYDVPKIAKSLIENGVVNHAFREAISKNGNLDSATKEVVPQLLEAWKKAPSSSDKFFWEILYKTGALPQAIDVILERWEKAPTWLGESELTTNTSNQFFIEILIKIGAPPQAIDVILKRLFVHPADNGSFYREWAKVTLIRLVPVSSLTEEAVNCVVKASTSQTGDSLTKLCGVNTPISSNILHLISNKNDITESGGEDYAERTIMSFQKERRAALDELKKRGNPPYRPEEYLKRSDADLKQTQ